MTLRDEALTAGRWTTASVAFRSGVQFAQTALLARLLVPADFGLMAMAGTAVALASLFADLGLSSALIHFSLPTKAIRSALYLLNIGMGLALGLLMCILAPSIARLYNEPALVPVLLALALTFPLNAMGQQFKALAEKKLRFSILAKIEIVSSLTALVAGVAAALLGLGVFALIVAVLTNATANALLLTYFLGRGNIQFHGLDFRGARPYLLYGGHRVGEQIWNTLRHQTDVVIASMAAGPGAVALYATPRQQSLRIASTVVNPVATRIGLPIMARVQNDLVTVRKIYMKTMRFTASVNFPTYAFIAIFPGEIVAVLLGSQWVEAAPYLRIFALWGLIRSTANPSGSLIYAVGMVRRAHAWNFINLVLAAPLLWFAERRWGLQGLAWTMLALQAALFIMAWRWLIFPACGAKFPEYIRELFPPLISSVIAAGCALLATAQLSTYLSLFIGAVTFGCAYLGMSAFTNRAWLVVMQDLARPMISISSKLRS